MDDCALQRYPPQMLLSLRRKKKGEGRIDTTNTGSSLHSFAMFSMACYRTRENN